MYKLSKKSLERLIGVHPRLVEFMKELIRISPHDFNIAQGMRTAKEQNAIYQQGRTKAGMKVTRADGYKHQSNHQAKMDGYGYAVDIGVLKLENGKLVYKGRAEDAHYYVDIYNKAKEHGLLEKYGIEWGGNCWKSYTDNPHWQIKGADRVQFKEGSKNESDYQTKKQTIL